MEQAKSKYSMLEEIGRGQYGVVYWSKRKSDSTSVAIKITNYKKYDRIQQLRKIILMKKCKHNIFTQFIEHYHWQGDNFCIVMELVEGVSLKQIRNSKGTRVAQKCLNS